MLTVLTACFRTAGGSSSAAKKARIAGRVSMDQTIVDVTDIAGVAIGDEAVLLGSQGKRSIDAWDLAELTVPSPGKYFAPSARGFQEYSSLDSVCAFVCEPGPPAGIRYTRQRRYVHR